MLILKKIIYFFICLNIFKYDYIEASTLRKTMQGVPPVVNTNIDFVFKNVGQGNGVILKNNANNRILIIDAGYSTLPANITDGESLATHLKEFFKFIHSNPDFHNICNSYQIIITHPDKDHINLINILYKTDINFKQSVQTIYLGGDISHYTSGTSKELLRNIIDSNVPENNIRILSHKIEDMSNRDFLSFFIRNPDILTTTPRRPFIMHLPIDSFLSTGQGGILEFLGINAYQSNFDKSPYNSYICLPGESYNDCLTNAKSNLHVEVPTTGEAVNGSSAVVRLKLGEANFIFTGDATDKTTKRILEKIPDINQLKTRILLASHHGADEHGTNSIEWVLATQPEIVVFSAGFSGTCKHPQFQSLFNYLMLLNSIYEVNPISFLNINPNILTQKHPIIFYTIVDHTDIVDAQQKTHSVMQPLINKKIIKSIRAFYHDKWVEAETERPIYTTSCPPPGQNEIIFTADSLGRIINGPVYSG